MHITFCYKAVMKAEIVMYAVLTLLKVCVIEYLLFLQLTCAVHKDSMMDRKLQLACGLSIRDSRAGKWNIHEQGPRGW